MNLKEYHMTKHEFKEIPHDKTREVTQEQRQTLHKKKKRR